MAGKHTKNIDCCGIRNVVTKVRWSLTAVVTYSRYYCIFIWGTRSQSAFMQLALHLQDPAEDYLDFLHLHLADAHLVVQLHKISCSHETGLGGRDSNTGYISPLQKLF